MRNEKVNYRDKEVLEKALRVKDIFFAMAAIFITLLNLWLASKLAPLSQDIAINKTNVSANADDIERVEDHIYQELRTLNNRIDEICNLVK